MSFVHRSPVILPGQEDQSCGSEWKPLKFSPSGLSELLYFVPSPHTPPPQFPVSLPGFMPALSFCLTCSNTLLLWQSYRSTGFILDQMCTTQLVAYWLLCVAFSPCDIGLG